MYTCGPTVYQTAHLGNFRAFLLSDLIRRTLEYQGFAVTQVMNITDVGHLTDEVNDAGDDKLQVAALKEKKSAWEIASYYTDLFWEHAEQLNLLKPHVSPKATAHIPEQITLIEQLEAQGFTYRTDDGIYFDTSKLADYGKLTGQDAEEKLAGARVEVNSQKRQPQDFALWKFSVPQGTTPSEQSESNGSQSLDTARDQPLDTARDQPLDTARGKRQMEWASPWGVGFPGWHIECSAMSVKYLKQPFDIHTGGIDHIAVHHSNEIAQSEAATNQPLANYWLHQEFMLVDGAKMSKSLNNTYTVDDLVERGYRPAAFRLLTLMTHYRKPLNFTWEALAAADHALMNLEQLAKDLPQVEEPQVPDELEERFREVISDDLGLPAAIAMLWEVLRSEESDEVKASVILRWDEVFGLGLANWLGQKDEIPERIYQLVNEREEYRKKGEYDKADGIRQEILAEGFDVRDTSEGPDIARVSH